MTSRVVKYEFQKTKLRISMEIMDNLVKTWQVCCTQKSTPDGVYFYAAMATH